jgi:hypothetical protein
MLALAEHILESKAIRQRHVGGDKIHAAFHQARDHRSASGQPIKPRDYKFGVIDPAACRIPLGLYCSTA